MAVLVSFFGAAFWMVDLVANYRPQLAVTALTLGLGGLVASRRGPAIVAIVCGLLGLASIAPHLVDSPLPVAQGSPTITVMSFNVGISNPNRTAVAEYIETTAPDVVFLFESSFEWEDTLRAADLPLQIVAIVPRGRLAGVTVLARPELHPGQVDVDLTGEVAAIAIDLGSERIEVLGIHPLSPTTAQRAAARDELIFSAATWVNGREGEVVVVGDLNATPWSYAFVRLRTQANLVDTLRGRGLQPTWPDGWGVLMVPIDHVLHTSGLGSAGRVVGPAFGSAHRPVLVEIGIAG